jgi:C4-dicarboxylate transporter, DctM subunit
MNLPERPRPSGLTGLLDRCSAGFDGAAAAASAFTMAALVVVVSTQVFFRYVLNAPLPWPEEVSGFLFAWLVFLGATVTVRRRQVPAVRVVVDKLPARLAGWLQDFSDALSLAIGGILIWQGLVACQAMWDQRSPALQIPMAYPLLVMPIAGLGFSLHFLAQVTARRSARQAAVPTLIGPLCVTVGMFVGALYLPGGAINYLLAISLVAGFLIGLPIAMVLILSSVLALLATSQALLILPQRLFSAVNNPVLMAIPFFMLTGSLMQLGGVARRLVDFCTTLVGRFRGGLAFVNIASSAIFSDISGSPVADTAAIGSIMLPEMVKRGYPPSFAAALQAASGSMGMLIPPSIATIIYSWLANVSVGAMFAASLLPALLMMASFWVTAYLIAVRRQFPRERPASGAEIVSAFRGTLWGLLAPLIILAGILSGAVTPSEAGVVAVLYTLLIVLGPYRSLNAAGVWASLGEAVISTTRVMLILSAALLLSWLLTIQQIPQQLSRSILSLSTNPIVLLILLMVILVLIHEVLETASTLMLIVPLVLPVFVQAGVDPMHLGILFLANSSLGIVTPQVGFLLYIAGAITGSRLEEVTRAIVPFWIAIIVDLILLIAFPHITMIVPQLLHAF